MVDKTSEFQQSIEHHARYSLAKNWSDLSPRDRFNAVSLAARQDD